MRVLALATLLFVSQPALAASPDDKPLQTPNTKQDPAWLLQGWTANILGITGNGKTLLVVEGEEGYQVTAVLDPATPAGETAASPATFTLADKDHRIPIKVVEPRGQSWEETVDVPKGMKVTVQVKARYEHIGYEGTIRNGTLECKRKQDRKWYRFELFQGDQAIGTHIDLEPGKTAPGVRLKIGTYDLKISERGAGGYTPLRTEKLEVKEQQWRFDLGCP